MKEPSLRQNPPGRTLAALTIFLSAFLLFAIQPLIAKMILPWFGGSASVWIACLLFFQAALLAGYAYAHLLTRRIPVRLHWMIHAFFLAASLLILPIIPSERWKAADLDQPLLPILELLSATVGLPFVLMAATGPLTQAWLSLRIANPEDGPSVYRLYALSNFGSLLALLSYPMLIEPWLSTRAQAQIWSGAYAVFAVCIAVLAWGHRAERLPIPPPNLGAGGAVGLGDRLVWFALAAVPSALLLAVTSQMLRNVAPIPLLWVIPLALYLLSLIICFDHSRWFYRPLWYGLLPFAVGGMTLVTAEPYLIASYALQLGIYAGAFFVCCMVSHGELARLKPATRHVTSFYLIVAGGGVAGALLIAAVAPAIFDFDRDLLLVLDLFTLLAGFVAWRRWSSAVPRWLGWSATLLVVGTSATLIWLFAAPLPKPGIEVLRTVRNFYGPLQATLRQDNAGPMLELVNGSIMHGQEFAAADRACEPLSYYARSSGIGAALEDMGIGRPLHVGFIGLGAGTLAAYARPDDTFRFYEINPQVRELATDVFRYLACGSGADVTLGDARLILEREKPNNFDLIAIDAFTSDAIPVHLLTREAFELYWRHIRPGGMLAVHVSNRYVELEPIVAAAAAKMGKTARALEGQDDESLGISASTWVLVTDDAALFTRHPFLLSWPIDPAAHMWTDDYSNLWRAMKW